MRQASEEILLLSRESIIREMVRETNRQREIIGIETKKVIFIKDNLEVKFSDVMITKVRAICVRERERVSTERGQKRNQAKQQAK